MSRLEQTRHDEQTRRVDKARLDNIRPDKMSRVVQAGQDQTGQDKRREGESTRVDKT